MDAWRYEFKLDISRVSAAKKLEHSKLNFISPRAHVLFSIYKTIKEIEFEEELKFSTSGRFAHESTSYE
jgi:hypothetical protein